MLKVVVYRSRWLRGKDASMLNDYGVMINNSYLLRPKDGKMCCLGFACLACGLSEEDINSYGEPECVCRDDDGNVRVGMYGVLVNKYGAHLEYIADMIKINDDAERDDESREAQLIKLAKELGTFEFEFVGPKQCE